MWQGGNVTFREDTISQAGSDVMGGQKGYYDNFLMIIKLKLSESFLHQKKLKIIRSFGVKNFCSI